MGLAVDHVVRDVDLRLRDDRVERGLAELVAHPALVELADPARDVLAQLVERVEAAGLQRELVVELGHALLADLLDVRLEAGGLAGQLLGAVVVGEADLEGAVLARLRADELVLEARDQPAGAELDRLAAALAALERLIVDVAGVVEHYEVAVLRLALDRLE